MEIIKEGIENYAKCECCGTEVEYDKYDLKWTHTEESYYYIICPKCREAIWLNGTPKLDQMYHEAYIEQYGNK